MTRNDDVIAVGAGNETGADRPRAGSAELDPSRWIEDHGDVLFRYAMLRLRDQSQAEEAVQECLLAALRGMDSFERRATVRTWLIGILKRKIVDLMRRRARERGVEDQRADAEPGFFDDRGLWRIVPKHWSEDPSDALQKGDLGPVMLECLRKLPAGHFEAIVLRELNQLPSDEVCEILAISPDSLWQRLHRARLGLRRCLEINWFATSKRGGMVSS